MPLVLEIVNGPKYSDDFALNTTLYFLTGGAQPDLYVCPDVAVGHFCSNRTDYIPVPCPVGTYSNTSGLTDASECTACDPGTYCAGQNCIFAQPTFLIFILNQVRTEDISNVRVSKMLTLNWFLLI